MMVPFFFLTTTGICLIDIRFFSEHENEMHWGKKYFDD